MQKQALLKKQEGVSLLELMIVVAIVSMIAAFAYPSYMEFTVRAKRTAATSTLMQIADRQQQFFMDNKQFTGNLTNLGYPANAIAVNDEGEVVAAGDADRVYSVTITAATATTYTLTAIPQLNQAKKDTKCGNLTLTHAGVKSQSGAGTNCW